MGRCSVCHGNDRPHAPSCPDACIACTRKNHNKTAHGVKCAICGAVGLVESIDVAIGHRFWSSWVCEDREAHEQVRSAFGRTDVGGDPAMASRRREKSSRSGEQKDATADEVQLPAPW